MKLDQVLERKKMLMAEWYQDFTQINYDIWVNLIIFVLFTEALS